MITFKCPECGEEMEVSDRKVGMEVECVKCGEMVEVPGKVRKKPRPTSQFQDVLTRGHLTMVEFLLAILIAFMLPGCNIFIGVMLYFILNDKYPTKAHQILQAASIAFFFYLIAGGCLWCISGPLNREPAPVFRPAPRP